MNNKEHFLFQESKELFEKENEDQDQEFRKMADRYYELNMLTRSIKFHTNNIKELS